jgi:hypothetical protein
MANTEAVLSNQMTGLEARLTQVETKLHIDPPVA